MSVSSDKIQEVLNAALNGDLKRIKELIPNAEIAKSFVSEDTGETLLMVTAKAADPGNIEVARYLVETLKLPLEQRDLNGNTALHVAANPPLDNSAMVEYLLSVGADPNACNNNLYMPDRNGETPLHIAVKSGKLATLKALFKVKEKLNYKLFTGYGSYNLLYEVGYTRTKFSPKRCFEMAQFLLEQRLQLIYAFGKKDGVTPLERYLANISDLFGIINLYRSTISEDDERNERIKNIKGEMSWNVYNDQMQTPLHHAIYCRLYKCAETIILNGSSVLWPDNQGKTAHEHIMGGQSFHVAPTYLMGLADSAKIVELTRDLDRISKERDSELKASEEQEPGSSYYVYEEGKSAAEDQEPEPGSVAAGDSKSIIEDVKLKLERASVKRKNIEEELIKTKAHLAQMLSQVINDSSFAVEEEMREKQRKAGADGKEWYEKRIQEAIRGRNVLLSFCETCAIPIPKEIEQKLEADRFSRSLLEKEGSPAGEVSAGDAKSAGERRDAHASSAKAAEPMNVKPPRVPFRGRPMPMPPPPKRVFKKKILSASPAPGDSKSVEEDKEAIEAIKAPLVFSRDQDVHGNAEKDKDKDKDKVSPEKPASSDEPGGISGYVGSIFRRFWPGE